MGLRVLHPTGDVRAQKDLRVDIVAVHGLNGDPMETWTNNKTNAFWLKDFLPLDIDGARVMTFGYNADAAFGNTTADINDHAKDLLSSLVDKREEDEEASRPLIFIAHSLGGIIVKKALFGARIESQYHTIFKNTLGIVFLGTPHRGSEKATYGHILANVATAVTHKPSSRLTSALKTNSFELQLLTSEFRHQLPNYQVVSFYEMRPTKPFSSLIVEKHSALLEVDGEDQIPVNADHRDMCKFAGRDDDVYEKLFKRLGRMMKGKGIEVDSGLRVTKSRNKHYVLPRHVSPKFTGRKEISQKLQEACLSKRDQKIQRRVVLYGMGGSGKTQICLKFAQDHRDHFWGIFWIDASSNESAERGFVEIAQICGHEADFTAAKRWLANLEDPWLLIIDNADNPWTDVSRYFPSGDRGTTLLTTRNPDCKIHATCGSFEIREMELDDAITLLLKTTEAEDDFDAASRFLAKPVVETLGCLALAIVQAGAVIRRGLCNMEEYCVVYSRHRKELLSHLPVQASDDYKYTVYTTFEVSIKMIENMSDDTSRNAIEILQLFCIFHYDGISENILKQAWENMRDDEYSDWTMSLQLGLLRQNTSQEWDSYPTREAISLLSSFSLITSSKTGDGISMHLHPLVNSWAIDKMSEHEQKRCWLKAASTLSMSIRLEFDFVDYQYRRFLLPHIDACLRLRTDELFVEGEGREERLDMASTFVRVYLEAGRSKRVIDLQERVVEGYRNVLGAENALTLREKSYLGYVYLEDGEAQKALGILEQVLKSQRGMHSKEHEDVLYTMNSLALCYSDFSRHHESKNLNQEILDIRKRVLGEQHPDTLNSMSNLAVSYRKLGQWQKAAELKERTLGLRTRVLSKEHPDTLSSMSSLAVSYSELNQWQKATELEERTLESRARVLGEEHPDTLVSMSNLAIKYGKLGQLQKAAELDERTLELRTKVLGKEHPNTLRSMNNLATSYRKLGQEQKAAELDERTLKLRTKFLGEEHPDTLRSMNNLAISYSGLGQWQEATELEERMLELSTRILGEEHSDTLRSMNNLTISYHELGRVEEAIRLCDKGLEISMRTLGEHDPQTVTFQENLAECRQESSPSLEVSAPNSMSQNTTNVSGELVIPQNTTNSPLDARPRKRWHPRRLLTKLRSSKGSD